MEELGAEKLASLLELKYRAVSEATARLGDPRHIRDAFVGFQKHLFMNEGDEASPPPDTAKVA